VIYFSTIYSAAWVVFTVSVVAVGLTVGLPFMVRRRQISSALRREKKQRFWAGLAILILASLFFVPIILVTANDYLFPHYSFGIRVNLLSGLSILGICISLVFMVMGLLLMILGIKKPSTG